MKHLWICLQISKKSVHHEAFVSIFQISNISCNMTQLWTFPDLKTSQCILAFVQMFRISREVVASWQIVNSFQISRRIQYAFPAPTYPGTPVLISLALATTFPNETPPSNLPARDQHTKKNLKRHMASFFFASEVYPPEVCPTQVCPPGVYRTEFAHLKSAQGHSSLWTRGAVTELPSGTFLDPPKSKIPNPQCRNP